MSLSSHAKTCYLLILLVASGGFFFTWQHFAPVDVAEGWTFRVYREDIPYVSALAIARDGRLYASEERRNGRGGRIIHLANDGSRNEGQAALFSGNNLEGIATDDHYLYAIKDVAEESRILRYDPKTRETTVLRTGRLEQTRLFVLRRARFVDHGRRHTYLHLRDFA